MKKKVLGIILALIVVPAMLFAVPVVVTWEWALDDPQVTTFRYQIGGEEPDKWIVVDASQTSYTVEGLDGSKSYSLYLQQSYDGEHFSSSAIATAEPLETAAEATTPAAAETPAAVATTEATAPAATETPATVVAAAPATAEVPAAPVKTEEAAPVKTETAPVAETAKPVEETKPVEAAKPAETAKAVVVVAPKKTAVKGTNNKFNWMLGLYGNVDYRLTSTAIASSHTVNIGLGLDTAFNNIFSFGKVSGIGISARAGLEPYNNTSWKQMFTSEFWSNWVYQLGADMTIDYDIAFGPKSGMKIGAGAFLVYPFNASTNTLAWGLVGDLGFDFGIGKKAYLSLDANYRYYLNKEYKNAMTLGLDVGLGFRF